MQKLLDLNTNRKVLADELYEYQTQLGIVTKVAG